MTKYKAETVSLAPPKETLDFTGERCTPWLTDPILSEHLHRYLSVLRITENKDVLDIACGEGFGSALMARNGAASVMGVDIDPDIIARAQRIYLDTGACFSVGDIRKDLSLETDSFDVVVCLETIEHIAEQEHFVSELRRVLRPGGVLIISTPDISRATAVGNDNPFHVRELSLNEFRTLVETQFTHTHLSHQRFVCGSMMVGEDERFEPEQMFWKCTGWLT